MENYSDIIGSVDNLLEIARYATKEDVRASIAKEKKTIEDFACMISPSADEFLEQLAYLSKQQTEKYFGKVLRLFAPIYVSNECINGCLYCGFSSLNKGNLDRRTLSQDEAILEIKELYKRGIRTLLIVAGEHPKFVSNDYLADIIAKASSFMPSISIEVAPTTTENYTKMVQSGCEGLTVFQETYNRPIYEKLHPKGPKKDFVFRLNAPERGAKAGMKKIGIGALLGLNDWQEETLQTALHAQYLQKKCWRSQIGISFPRMRPVSEAPWTPEKKNIPSDKELLKMICAYRLLIPRAALTISTRENATFRNNLIGLGVTNMSAAASTEPGGYAKLKDLPSDKWYEQGRNNQQQFDIADTRTPFEFCQDVIKKGYEPVWKDYDKSMS